MKQTILLFVLITSFISCNQADKQHVPSDMPDTSGIVTTTPDFKTLDTSVPFAGIWVNEKYINDIKKNKSPRDAQNVKESCITIPRKTLRTTRMINGFHEGGEDWTIVKNEDKYQLYTDHFAKLAREITVSSPDRLKIGNESFIRLRHGDENKSNLNILEEILFSGQYQSANGNMVVFTTDGEVTGLGDLHYYSSVIDYDDMASDVDQLELGKTKDDLHRFGFRFNKDELTIYNLKCKNKVKPGEECESVEFGKVAYRLTKSK